MRYNCIKPNDVANGDGVCVSLYVQGCEHYCEDCFNEETWDFNGGKEFTYDTLKEILSLIDKNGITRNFCVLGGEPFHENNWKMVYTICCAVKERFPNMDVYVWTGYTIEELSTKHYLPWVFNPIDYLIDGKFEKDKKDITLRYKGSTNQRVIDIKETFKNNMIVLKSE